ncbi:protein of unknown function [Taphrina deformans PYCC 5710]|uniref:Uncharacterized protein n=1 Tax=Taphrina deformans (strain PYCC 5710 / ATCC 11124 / CBS 356.35 / IMI 108563 / JCM 9778 / NBRC 8474) TaxID=1097556 RepID=R4X832_TAPDE|nr:protein of unknown function [Taphrina deformans PYCC 5710]|eukprot:CCG81619.1 protein of unknown function [Taphrina deformans PYCC 5710]
MSSIPKKLFLGKFKGAHGNQINFRLPARTSNKGYFQIRYYPQIRQDPLIDKIHTAQVKHFEDRLGVVHLNQRLIISFIVSIAKTSKKASVRKRLQHRLGEAFRAELRSAGPSVLPAQPMHVLFTPSMRVLMAPFGELRQDAMATYLTVKNAFDSLSATKKASMTPSSTGSRVEPPGNGGKPVLYNSQSNLERRIRSSRDALQSSTYLKASGGAMALLDSMKQISSHDDSIPNRSMHKR